MSDNLPPYDEAAALRLLDAINAHARQPRAFVLQRREDVSGVSGTGIVAQGVEFEDGTVALRWLSAWPTSVVFHDKGIDAVKAVHGHDGRTRVVWADNCGDAAAVSS